MLTVAEQRIHMQSTGFVVLVCSTSAAQTDSRSSAEEQKLAQSHRETLQGASVAQFVENTQLQTADVSAPS